MSYGVLITSTDIERKIILVVIIIITTCKYPFSRNLTWYFYVLDAFIWNIYLGLGLFLLGTENATQNKNFSEMYFLLKSRTNICVRNQSTSHGEGERSLFTVTRYLIELIGITRVPLFSNR